MLQCIFQCIWMHTVGYYAHYTICQKLWRPVNPVKNQLYWDFTNIGPGLYKSHWHLVHCVHTVSFIMFTHGHSSSISAWLCYLLLYFHPSPILLLALLLLFFFRMSCRSYSFFTLPPPLHSLTSPSLNSEATFSIRAVPLLPFHFSIPPSLPLSKLLSSSNSIDHSLPMFSAVTDRD